MLDHRPWLIGALLLIGFLGLFYGVLRVAIEASVVGALALALFGIPLVALFTIFTARSRLVFDCQSGTVVIGYRSLFKRATTRLPLAHIRRVDSASYGGIGGETNNSHQLTFVLSEALDGQKKIALPELYGRPLQPAAKTINAWLKRGRSEGDAT